MWHIIHNFIHTFNNLQYKRLMNTTLCPRCNEDAKLILHVIRDCKIEKEVWENLNFKWPQKPKNMRHIVWISYIFNQYSKSQCRLFVCALQAIWTNRTKWVHEKSSQDGLSIVRIIMNYIKQLDDLGIILPLGNRIVERWKISKVSCIKANFDVAYRKHEGVSYSGILLRDLRGEVITSKITLHERILSLFTTEAVACTMALKISQI